MDETRTFTITAVFDSNMSIYQVERLTDTIQDILNNHQILATVSMSFVKALTEEELAELVKSL